MLTCHADFFTDKSTRIQEEKMQAEILTFCPSHCFLCMFFVNLFKNSKKLLTCTFWIPEE